MENTKKIILLVGLLCLAVFIMGAPLHAAAPYRADSLIKSSHAEVFLVAEGGVLRWIPNEATFTALGYSWSDIIVIPDSDLILYTWGDALSAAESKSILPTLAESEAKVREYFFDIPVMIPIAQCESKFRQFNSDGTVLRSSNGLYVGVYQISEKIHAAGAKNLGMDIYTLEGNLAYARRLYETSGLQPWPTCSRTNASLAASGLLIDDLKFDDTNAQVKILQQLLNKAGFTVAESGVGSSGNETEYFGVLTRVAVQRFQCAKGIACDGTESTTGYGRVGPKTRAALNSL